MPLGDLDLYRQYTARRGFPGRRIEQLLAQVALVLAQVNGAKGLSLADFLFDPPDPEAQARQRERDMRDFFND